MKVAKYKVYFEGFAYVEATNESIAQLAYEEDDVIYSEEEITEIVEVEDFAVEV